MSELINSPIGEYDFQKQWDLAYPNFKKLFDLDSRSLVEKVKDICVSLPKDFITGKWKVKKVIQDDIPWEITLEFYDSIWITPFGIKLKEEYGYTKDLYTYSQLADLSL